MYLPMAIRFKGLGCALLASRGRKAASGGSFAVCPIRANRARPGYIIPSAECPCPGLSTTKAGRDENNSPDRSAAI